MRPRSLAALIGAVASTLSIFVGTAHAHSTSTAYLDIDASTRSAPVLHWRIALRDIDALLDLDVDGDGRLQWGEVSDRAADITALATSNIAVRSGAAACALRFAEPHYVRVADAGYAQLDAAAVCSTGDSTDGALTLDYRLFEEVDPSHRVLITLTNAGQPRIVGPGATFELVAAGHATDAPSGFGGFLRTGIGHIAGGFDHVLFLLCLLLPAVLQRQHAANAGRWVARDNVRSALIAVIWIATAFTIAHSLTLALATFDVIRIPARVIEPLIALTIVATALNNVWPVVTRRLAAVAFAFGLIHGFGFAEVLAPLSLPRGELALALFGFNLGVEIGQLIIVAGAFFVLATLRRWRGYARWVLGLGSVLIAVIAALWFVERAFDVSLLGF